MSTFDEAATEALEIVEPPVEVVIVEPPAPSLWDRLARILLGLVLLFASAALLMVAASQISIVPDLSYVECAWIVIATELLLDPTFRRRLT